MESSLVTTKGQIVIPKKIRDKYNFAVGVRVCFSETADGVLLQPLDKEYYASQKGILPNNDTSSVWDWKKELRTAEFNQPGIPAFTLNEPVVSYKKSRQPKRTKK